MPYLHYFSNHKCPKCEHSSNFSVLYASAISVADKRSNDQVRWRESDSKFRLLCTCGNCKEPQTIEVEKKPEPNNQHRNSSSISILSFLNRLQAMEVNVPGRSPAATRVMTLDAKNFGQDLRYFFRITSVYPGALDDTPSDLPEEMRALWEEFEEVRTSARYTCVACRKLIEAVCNRELTTVKGNLQQKIDRLVSEGFLPKSMGDWAHAIRLLGNEAAHENQKPSPREASELKEYTKMLLELQYSIPARISRQKAPVGA